MPKKRRPARPRENLASLKARVCQLEESLANCTSEIERITKDTSINVRRMGEMQNQIDQLCAAAREPKA
jgi:hypothetical protein